MISTATSAGAGRRNRSFLCICSRNRSFDIVLIIIIINIVFVFVVMILQNCQVMVTSFGFCWFSALLPPLPRVLIVGVPVTSRGRWMQGDEG